ncbi:tubulin-folding cofactor B-like [Apostichopus japonicus]|uniref:tubulin-folding cofactor B-like n=1 Tax=Stichopus japonicus TaxID=307972 RepID=UPI003AB63D07
MSGEFQVITQAYVNVFITSTLTSFEAEKRFAKDVTIGTLKSKLELISGSNASSMKLQLMDKEGKLVGALDNDEALLGSYPVDDGMKIHVIDTSEKTKGEFEDVSQVEKYEIPDEEYAKRSDSVRAFKLKHKMGQFKEVDPEEKARKEAEQKAALELEENLIAKMAVGSRCEVNVPNNPPVKRGTVMYLGKTDFKPGYWVGVQYDEPLGKNNGSVKGKKYFTCEEKYGGFVKPQYVTVGDFPVQLDEEMDEM